MNSPKPQNKGSIPNSLDSNKNKPEKILRTQSPNLKVEISKL